MSDPEAVSSIKKGNERLRRLALVLLVLMVLAGFVGAAALIVAFDRIPEPEIERIAIIDIQGDAHQESIECLVDLSIVGGYPDGTYQPGETVTRGQMAGVVARMLDHLADGGEGCPEPS